MLVFVDIDATCSDSRLRFAHAGPEPHHENRAEHHKWLAKFQTDEKMRTENPVKGMPELVTQLKDVAVYLTGRSSRHRVLTREWLAQNGFPDLLLIMRSENDYREASVFKKWAIEKTLTAIDEPVIVIDDDPKQTLEKVCYQTGWCFLKARSGT